MASPVNRVNGFAQRQASTAPIEIALAAHPSQADPYNPTSPTSPSNLIYSSPNAAKTGSAGSANRARKASNLPQPKALTEFKAGEDGSVKETKKGVKALLLENVRLSMLCTLCTHILVWDPQVSESGIAILRGQNYVVDTEKASLSEDELIAKLREGQYQILGIRSKTKVTKKVIESCTSVGDRTST